MDRIQEYADSIFTYHNDLIFFQGSTRRQITKNKKEFKIFDYKEFRFDKDVQTKKIIKDLLKSNNF